MCTIFFKMTFSNKVTHINLFNSFSTSTCFVLFVVIYLLRFDSLSSKSVFVTKLACAILALKISTMDISSSIRHRFDVEIPRGTFVEITWILKGESTWKLWRIINVDSTFKIGQISICSPRGIFYVVSTSNWCNFCTRFFHSIIF